MGYRLHFQGDSGKDGYQQHHACKRPSVVFIHLGPFMKTLTILKLFQPGRFAAEQAFRLEKECQEQKNQGYGILIA